MKLTPLERALYQSIPHVWRQQFAGSHEQDRIDAKKWFVDPASSSSFRFVHLVVVLLLLGMGYLLAKTVG